MIDWWTLAANSLWILGLAVLLAAFAYHDWLGRATGQGRAVFARSSWRVARSAGCLLACVGWGWAQATGAWQRTAWFLLAAGCAVGLARRRRANRP